MHHQPRPATAIHAWQLLLEDYTSASCDKNKSNTTTGVSDTAALAAAHSNVREKVLRQYEKLTNNVMNTATPGTTALSPRATTAGILARDICRSHDLLVEAARAVSIAPFELRHTQEDSAASLASIQAKHRTAERLPDTDAGARMASVWEILYEKRSRVTPSSAVRPPRPLGDSIASSGDASPRTSSSMPFATFCSFMTVVYHRLVPHASAELCRRALQEDWSALVPATSTFTTADLVLSRKDFEGYLIDIAHVWCETSDAVEYAHFIARAFVASARLCTVTPDPTRLTYTFDALEGAAPLLSRVPKSTSTSSLVSLVPDVRGLTPKKPTTPPYVSKPGAPALVKGVVPNSVEGHGSSTWVKIEGGANTVKVDIESGAAAEHKNNAGGGGRLEGFTPDLSEPSTLMPKTAGADGDVSPRAPSSTTPVAPSPAPHANDDDNDHNNNNTTPQEAETEVEQARESAVDGSTPSPPENNGPEQDDLPPPPRLEQGRESVFEGGDTDPSPEQSTNVIWHIPFAPSIPRGAAATLPRSTNSARREQRLGGLPQVVIMCPLFLDGEEAEVPAAISSMADAVLASDLAEISTRANVHTLRETTAVVQGLPANCSGCDGETNDDDDANKNAEPTPKTFSLQTVHMIPKIDLRVVVLPKRGSGEEGQLEPPPPTAREIIEKVVYDPEDISRWTIVVHVARDPSPEVMAELKNFIQDIRSTLLSEPLPHVQVFFVSSSATESNTVAALRTTLLLYLQECLDADDNNVRVSARQQVLASAGRVRGDAPTVPKAGDPTEQAVADTRMYTLDGVMFPFNSYLPSGYGSRKGMVLHKCARGRKFCITKGASDVPRRRGDGDGLLRPEKVIASGDAKVALVPAGGPHKNVDDRAPLATSSMTFTLPTSASSPHQPRPPAMPIRRPDKTTLGPSALPSRSSVAPEKLRPNCARGTVASSMYDLGAGSLQHDPAALDRVTPRQPPKSRRASPTKHQGNRTYVVQSEPVTRKPRDDGSDRFRQAPRVRPVEISVVSDTVIREELDDGSDVDGNEKKPTVGHIQTVVVRGGHSTYYRNPRRSDASQLHELPSSVLTTSYVPPPDVLQHLAALQRYDLPYLDHLSRIRSDKTPEDVAATVARLTAHTVHMHRVKNIETVIEGVGKIEADVSKVMPLSLASLAAVGTDAVHQQEVQRSPRRNRSPIRPVRASLVPDGFMSAHDDLPPPPPPTKRYDRQRAMLVEQHVKYQKTAPPRIDASPTSQPRRVIRRPEDDALHDEHVYTVTSLLMDKSHGDVEGWRERFSGVGGGKSSMSGGGGGKHGRARKLSTNVVGRKFSGGGSSTGRSRCDAAVSHVQDPVTAPRPVYLDLTAPKSMPVLRHTTSVVPLEMVAACKPSWVDGTRSPKRQSPSTATTGTKFPTVTPLSSEILLSNGLEDATADAGAALRSGYRTVVSRYPTTMNV